MAKNKKEQLITKREYILIGDDMPFAITEAYKALRTNLMFVLGAKNTKVTMFTSAYMMEGKTTTSANIAITFAQTGAKVLLIDAENHDAVLAPRDRQVGVAIGCPCWGRNHALPNFPYRCCIQDNLHV